jgi:hypothetical protein
MIQDYIIFVLEYYLKVCANRSCLLPILDSAGGAGGGSVCKILVFPNKAMVARTQTDCLNQRRNE